MRTKLCVLGAVLGTASVLPVVCMPPEPVARKSQEEQTKGNVSLKAGRVLEGQKAEPVKPAGVPTAPAKASPEVPKHPCELITVMQVPCDPTAATCEYTYWECPQNVDPLRA